MMLVITANTNACRLFYYEKHPAKLTLFKKIEHPENKLKTSEITSDRPGHYQGGESSRGAYSPHMDAKEVEIDNFSREIARVLNHERNENKYDKLMVITLPHMSGLISQHLDKHVKDLIVSTVHKDLHDLTNDQLLAFLKTNAE